MKFFDVESVGLHGPIVLIQYADGIDGEIKLHSVWKESINDTLEILDKIIYDPEGVVGFNIAFDHFHVCQIYTTLILIPREKWNDPPDITEYALLEKEGRYGPCIKPTKACDLMLHARKGPYQSVMQREDIRIKKVPTKLAWQLVDELNKRIKLKDIYFARKKDKTERWKVFDIEGNDGRMDPDFKDIVLGFRPSSALKALAVDALGLDPDEVLKFENISLSKAVFPKELGYAPFALAVGTPANWNGAWPDYIRYHISHWTYNELAREYAKKDVEYLQKLYPYFGSPELGDDDSELACMVGACRWRGFAIDLEGIQKLRDETENRRIKILDPEQSKGKLFLDSVPDKPGYKRFKIPTAPRQAKAYIQQVMSPMERAVDENKKLASTTKKTVLEDIVKSELWKDHPVAQRAKEVLDARQAQYEEDFYDKLLLAGRFHASSAIIGSLSGRMSGGGSARGIEGGGRAKGDGLNPQGVKRTKEVRSKFPLADNGLELSGGDFSGFEVCLAAVAYNDPELIRQLQLKRPCSFCLGKGTVIAHGCKGKDCKKCVGDNKTCKECNGKGLVGTKIHALFGESLFPHLTYDEIVASAGSAEDFYDKSKRAFFAVIYGGEANTLNNRIGIPVEIASEALRLFGERFPEVGKHRKKIANMFVSMKQVGGIGTKVEWNEPADYIESMLGFRRYFTLENKICKALFQLAEDPPKSWLELNIKLVRRDRVQTAGGAVRSALFASAFALQSANMRAAANHVIQSTGAQITKIVQRKIWDLQPPGVNGWMVQPLNVHDEIQCPTRLKEEVAKVVNEAVESLRPKIPLIKMDWQKSLNSWADKS